MQILEECRRLTGASLMESFERYKAEFGPATLRAAGVIDVPVSLAKAKLLKTNIFVTVS